MKRTATALWTGTGKEGKGALTTQSGLIKGNQYSYTSRFEEGIGTNPEELIAAALAGCYSMKLSFVISGKNITPDTISTTASITNENGSITKIDLDVTAKVPGLEDFKFQDMAKDALANCTIAKALNPKITMTATLL